MNVSLPTPEPRSMQGSFVDDDDESRGCVASFIDRFKKTT